MKMSKSFINKAAYFYRLGKDTKYVMPADRIPLDINGKSALQCFHQYESIGIIPPCKEPFEFYKYTQGKIWHGVTVEIVAKGFAIEHLIFSKEIKEDYPEWVQEEIFQQATKIAKNHYGYVPTFIVHRKDYSEL